MRKDRRGHEAMEGEEGGQIPMSPGSLLKNKHKRNEGLRVCACTHKSMKYLGGAQCVYGCN